MAAVGNELISRIVGYTITKGDFSTSSPNLPQRIAILGEANTANQSGLSTEATEVTTAQQAGELYGFGSPIHSVMRILRPVSGDGVGGIPTVVYAQAAAGGAVAKIIDLTPTGTATGSGVHTVVIAGREGVDGESYDFNVTSGDTVADITAKIETVVNAVLGCPVTASDATTKVVLTSKWAGLTSNTLQVSVNTNGNALGMTYAVAEDTAGSGSPTVTASLNKFNNDWNTLVVNCYDLSTTAVLTELESFNGIPDPETPTGRYAGIIMKPFIALTGSVADDPSSVTDPRSAQVTVAVCPAPGSKGQSYEAAANMAVLCANIAQDTPHLDVSGKSYPDMPTPTSIGSMAQYANRDAMVKDGCSTVDLVAGAYQVQDFVTTYHPAGEVPPQFRYCRNLLLDFNVRYGYYLLEQANVVDHVIANDDDTVSAAKTVKPKQWKGIVDQYATDLSVRGLIADPEFTQDSITVGISSSNPDRLETFFRYKRTGVARISSTTAEAGFNFGTV